MLSLALTHWEWDEELQSAGQSFPDVLQGLCVHSCRRLWLVGNHPSFLICAPSWTDGSHRKETWTAWHLSWLKLRSPGCWQLLVATCCYSVLRLTGNGGEGGVQRRGKCGVSAEAEIPLKARCALQYGFSLSFLNSLKCHEASVCIFFSRVELLRAAHWKGTWGKSRASVT